MNGLEEFFITWAESALRFHALIRDRMAVNRKKFGIQDESLVDKIDFVLKCSTNMKDDILRKFINAIGKSGLENLDECLRNEMGTAIGTMGSYIPFFVHMNSRLCERDFDCNYDNLVASGMRVSEVADELYLRLMGQRSFIPPIPIPNFVFVDNVIDLYHQTDIIFFMDIARMSPEHKIICSLEDMTVETSKMLIMATAFTPQMCIEYTNLVNMISHRPYYPPNHDFAVVFLSLLEVDKEYYSDGTFYNSVEGAEDFVKCMIAQSKKAEPFLERLRKILRQ